MKTPRGRVLLVDTDRTLARALAGALASYDVETAYDVVDAIHKIDCCSHRPHDIILCDVACGEVSGPELWSYLSITRKFAADRMVFVASGALRPETRAFLDGVPNACIMLLRAPESRETESALA